MSDKEKQFFDELTNLVKRFGLIIFALGQGYNGEEYNRRNAKRALNAFYNMAADLMVKYGFEIKEQ